MINYYVDRNNLSDYTPLWNWTPWFWEKLSTIEVLLLLLLKAILLKK